MQQNKTTLLQSPVTTLGQETRWAYSTTLPSPHGAPRPEYGGHPGCKQCAGKLSNKQGSSTTYELRGGQKVLDLTKFCSE